VRPKSLTNHTCWIASHNDPFCYIFHYHCTRTNDRPTADPDARTNEGFSSDPSSRAYIDRQALQWKTRVAKIM
jgi:hypothetical protein